MEVLQKRPKRPPPRLESNLTKPNTHFRLTLLQSFHRSVQIHIQRHRLRRFVWTTQIRNHNLLMLRSQLRFPDPWWSKLYHFHIRPYEFRPQTHAESMDSGLRGTVNWHQRQRGECESRTDDANA